MIPLSEKTKKLIEKIFPLEKVEYISKEIENRVVTFAGNDTPETLERIRFAILKITNTNKYDFENAIQLANTDWRDLLVNAGFSDNMTEHENWAKKTLEL